MDRFSSGPGAGGGSSPERCPLAHGQGDRIHWSFYRSAAFVETILKGAKPADLPVERVGRFDFVVNLQAAQALGVTLPKSAVDRASEVIQ